MNDDRDRQLLAAARACTDEQLDETITELQDVIQRSQELLGHCLYERTDRQLRVAREQEPTA